MNWTHARVQFWGSPASVRHILRILHILLPDMLISWPIKTGQSAISGDDVNSPLFHFPRCDVVIVLFYLFAVSMQTANAENGVVFGCCRVLQGGGGSGGAVLL